MHGDCKVKVVVSNSGPDEIFDTFYTLNGLLTAHELKHACRSRGMRGGSNLGGV